MVIVIETMFLFLLIFVPTAVIGQDTTVSTVLDPQCVEEFHKILSRNRTVFNKVYDVDLNEEWMDRNLAEELGNNELELSKRSKESVTLFQDLHQMKLI
ncbi:hypothetical protein GCK72_012949 [Caenorhabditis remanei]|uniref:Uncharacterized protein n=1 Tax=Caenorhabditis remanei TaxID=31234 RepID=A0A6A5GPQ1_CAERE|nr:hypothetical protein GCK72_012945 [Caenorhabditis remanei]XP_053584297.1 hypothetical protein GCK72_012949 [Caenorhabditis remanei]KAF1756492.1 hypothetical protein GCK72_012945 [Caenorhabditis remanei]KAF1756496.1 hypothetical protein GCK72_012949 [Caenorhabditis remanei]